MLVLPDNNKKNSPGTYSVIISSLLIITALIAVFFYTLHLPGAYNSDSLQLEDMYRDLIIKKNPWALWGLPGAALYSDIAVYFIIRTFFDMAQTMALNSTLIAFSFIMSTLYMVFPFLSSRQKEISLFIAPLWVIVSCTPYFTINIVSVLYVHNLPIVAAFFCAGIFFRYISNQYN